MWYHSTMLNVLVPFVILFSISTGFALPFSSDLISFSKYFVCFTVIQIIGYNVYKKYIQLNLEKIKNDRIREFSKQGLEIKCPCHLNKTMFVPITLNQDNAFKCGECSKNVSVEVSARTFLETEIVNLEAADAALIEAYKKIQQEE